MKFRFSCFAKISWRLTHTSVWTPKTKASLWSNRVLFQDRLDIWQEIEARVNSDNDSPVVKTASKVGD